MPNAAIRPETLAGNLASRLIHDIMGPASGVVTGLDLLTQPGAEDMHDEALALAAGSARKLLDLLAFCRATYGMGVEAIDAREMERLARGMFKDARPTLVWSVAVATIPAVSARVLLGLTQIAAGALAAGGVTTVTVETVAGRTLSRVEANGSKVSVPAETLIGLRGEPFGVGLAGRWAPAAYLHASVAAAGGTLSSRLTGAGLIFDAALP